MTAAAALSRLLLPLPCPEDFDPAQTLDCGQTFRFVPAGDGWWEGVAGRSACRVRREGPAIAVEYDGGEGARAYWENYFDLARDYSALKRRLSADPVLARAIAYCPGVRVLRQDGWEALCSFLLSQNNNIARIKGIIRALCENFGEPLPGGGHAFPTPEAIARRPESALLVLRAGYRAGYLHGAARQVAGGELDLAALYTLPVDEARGILRGVRGVGPKVAECVLLYGFARAECFPRDVWILRALERLYPGGFPQAFGDVAGIAQQYLFHYCRTCPGALE